MFQLAADAHNTDVGFGSVKAGPASCKSDHVRYAAESRNKPGILVKQRSRIMLMIQSKAIALQRPDGGLLARDAMMAMMSFSAAAAVL